MRYGWFMARNGDDTGAGGESAGWLGHVCARLKAKVDEALDAVCDAPKVEGVAEAGLLTEDETQALIRLGALIYDRNLMRTGGKRGLRDALKRSDASAV